MVEALTRYVQISALWVRAGRAYRASWWMLTVGGFFATGVEFVGIWIVFQNVGSLGGFGLREVAFLYGAAGSASPSRTCSWAASSGRAR